MKKILVFLVLSVLCWLPAKAQVTPPAPAASAPVDMADSVNLLCTPSPRGTGTWPTIRFSIEGGIIWWYCKHPTSGKWVSYYMVGMYSLIYSKNLGQVADAALSATNPLTASNAAISASITHRMDDPRFNVVYQAFKPAIDVNWPAPDPVIPPPSLYVVATNGTSVTRPSFAVVNGVRSFSSRTTVAVGAPCSDALKLVEGKLTFLKVGEPNLVAVCVLKTP